MKIQSTHTQVLSLDSGKTLAFKYTYYNQAFIQVKFNIIPLDPPSDQSLCDERATERETHTFPKIRYAQYLEMSC